MGPCFSSTEDDPIMTAAKSFWLLQWGRASAARKTARIPSLESAEGWGGVFERSR